MADAAVIVGSLRAESFTRKIASAAINLAPFDCRFIEIGELALYNEDLDQDPPAPWQRFRAAVRGASGVLFFTPEYNRSVPGGLKNAVDVGSRPQGQSVWDGMPAGVVSVTPYKLGAFGANHALRQTFVFLNMLVMQQPEAYIGDAKNLLNDDGSLKSKDTEEFLRKFMSAFDNWMKKLR